MSSRITIKSIANELNISFSTVSKALNNDPSIRAQTRALVTKKAIEMGYQPNLMARGLRNKSSRCVAIILNGLNNSANTYMIHTLASFLLRYDYATIIFESQVNLQTEKKNIQAALSRLPDCIIISPVARNDENLALLKGMEDRVIYLDSSNEDQTDGCHISVDHESAGKLAALTILNYGYNNILVMSGEDNYPSCHDFICGIQIAFQENHIPFHDDSIVRCVSSFSAGHDTFVEYYLNNQNRFKQRLGIISFCDSIAFGVYHAANELGLSIPTDISIIGYDDNEFCLLANPPLSSIHYPKEEVVKLCCDMLISLFSSNELPKTHSILHPHIVERKSIQSRK